jgi:uncharacterized membrane protein SpoIIM required for sporulation
MISNLWMDSRKNNWNRLDALVRQVEKTGVKSLSPVELRDLGMLYRQGAADLSAVRADRTSRTLEQYLNRLVGRAHNYVYSGRRVSVATLWQFFAYGYPRLLRRLSGYVTAATAIFLFSGLLGALITILRPDFAVVMLGTAMMDKINSHQMWTESILSVKPQEASGIMTHNIMVCLATFAGGVVAGLGTIYLLFFNGLQIATVLTCCFQHGMGMNLLSFMTAHGALEIPSIMFAGAAGLRLAAGILFPGMLRRRDALALAGTEAVQLLSAIIPLLIVAGSLEAFLSPTHTPMALKFSVGAVLFTGLVWWLGRGGRRSVESRA